MKRRKKHFVLMIKLWYFNGIMTEMDIALLKWTNEGEHQLRKGGKNIGFEIIWNSISIVITCNDSLQTGFQTIHLLRHTTGELCHTICNGGTTWRWTDSLNLKIEDWRNRKFGRARKSVLRFAPRFCSTHFPWTGKSNEYATEFEPNQRISESII